MNEDKLREMLNVFKQEYSNAKVMLEIENITDCFNASFPKNFGKQPTVLCYVIKNGLSIEKYTKFSNGRYKTKEFDNNFKILSCLCVKHLQNTSFSEVYSIFKKQKRKRKGNSVGFYKKQLNNIASKLKINKDKDQVFMFALNNKEILKKKIRLSQIWTKQMLDYGGKALDVMEDEERKLIKDLYGSLIEQKITLERIKPYSYMYGRKHHTIESEIFLYNKLRNAQKWK